MVRQQRNEPSLLSIHAFKGLLALLATGLLIQLLLVFNHDGIVGVREVPEVDVIALPALHSNSHSHSNGRSVSAGSAPHLFPYLPPLPALALIENGDALSAKTLSGEPTIAGIAAVLQRFLIALHYQQKRLASEKASRDQVVDAFIELTKQHLLPLDAPYRGKSVFPVREDGSIFISVASYRDHMLSETLRQAFGKATHPDRIFIGAVVQNCFGIDYTCRTGMQVVGKNAKGRDMTKISDAPPDSNGIAEFCEDDKFKQFCDSGQVRALYVNETESLGPAMARYYASKLWGGETYYVQVDAHLQFAPDWDQKYIDELKATKSHPKAVLSSYPPGFSGHSNFESPGARLCTCQFPTTAVEHDMLRINTGIGYSRGAKAPTQIPYIAAGFFFARAELIRDIPFDPFLPWVFMGEEIALSMRAWTFGWNIYAPRINLITHQYRPGYMGLPKYWETVGRAFNRPGAGFNTQLQTKVIDRVKHLVGYPDATREILEENGSSKILTDYEHYGLGNVRSREDYLELTKIDVVNKRCGNIKWCNNGELL